MTTTLYPDGITSTLAPTGASTITYPLGPFFVKITLLIIDVPDPIIPNDKIDTNRTFKYCLFFIVILHSFVDIASSLFSLVLI